MALVYSRRNCTECDVIPFLGMTSAMKLNTRNTSKLFYAHGVIRDASIETRRRAQECRRYKII